MSYAAQAAAGKYHDLRIEAGGRGLTYSHSDGVTVYGFITNSRTSVHAGQETRCYLGHYDSAELALVDFPTASVASNSSFVSHSSDIAPAWCTPAYEAETGERWSDDR